MREAEQGNDGTNNGNHTYESNNSSSELPSYQLLLTLDAATNEETRYLCQIDTINLVTPDQSEGVNTELQLAMVGTTENENENEERNTGGVGLPLPVSLSSSAIARKEVELQAGSSSLKPLTELFQEAVNKEKAQSDSGAICDKKKIKMFDIPKSGSKAMLMAEISTGNISDGFMGMADVSHVSDLAILHREGISHARNRKCCTEAADYMVPEAARTSLTDAKDYLRKLAKQSCFENGVRQDKEKKNSCNFRVNVEDIEMMDSSDFSLPSVKGNKNEEDGFAEVGPSQPPLLP